MPRLTLFTHRFSYTVAARDVDTINALLTRHGYGPCIHHPLSEGGEKVDTPTHYIGIITLDEVGLAIFRWIFRDSNIAFSEREGLRSQSKEYLTVTECTSDLNLKPIKVDVDDPIEDPIDPDDPDPETLDTP